MNEKISRKDALKRIAMIGGAVVGAAAVSSCIPTLSYSKYCNGACESFSSVTSYCNYSNWANYCDNYYPSYYSYSDCYYYC